MTESPNPINIEETLADAVLNRPREFFIHDKRFELWSPTLGMSILIDRLISTLDIDKKGIIANPALEALRLCSIEKETVCSILAIYTLKEYESLCNSLIRKEREKELSSLSTDELARLFLFVLTDVKTETLISLTEIAKDQEKQSEIARLKNKEGHNVSFGGKTLYGILIDTACAKYGWTKEYVVWGIDLISLRMMLADSINSVYLTDEELKQVRLDSSSQQVFGMTKEDIEKLKAMDWS